MNLRVAITVACASIPCIFELRNLRISRKHPFDAFVVKKSIVLLAIALGSTTFNLLHPCPEAVAAYLTSVVAANFQL